MDVSRPYITCTSGSYVGGGTSYINLGANVTNRDSNSYDYLAISDHYPTGPKDYLTNVWCYISNMTQVGSYCYYTSSDYLPWNVNKSIDLSSLSNRWIFRVGWINGDWQIIDTPVQFQQQPKWMESIIQQIGGKKLSQICIPGSHDSGTYYPVSATGWPWVATQNMSFINQLNRGIRYFDCRVTLYQDNATDHFWFCHDTWNTYVPLAELINDVSCFLRFNTKEIVILDFSHFDSQLFTDAFLIEFWKRIAEMISVLGFVLPSSQDVNDSLINDLIRNNKRLVILTDNSYLNATYGASQSLNVYSNWANTDDPATLKQFLDTQVIPRYKDTDGLWLLQAVLTTQKSYSVGGLADILAPYVNDWMKNDWANVANVVFTDFVLGNLCVEMAIDANKNR